MTLTVGIIVISALLVVYYGSRRPAGTIDAGTPATGRGGNPAFPSDTAVADDSTASPPLPPPTRAEAAAHLGERLQKTFSDVVERYKLPPLPTAVTQAMTLIGEPYVELDRLCRVLSADPALAGRIMSLSRSPIFALYRQPQTLLEAASVLGFGAMKRILMTAGMQTMRTGPGPESERLWRHSLATALAAHILARRVGHPAPDQVYLAGLLHEIGHIVFLQSSGAALLDLWSGVAGDPARGCHAEIETYGRDHAFVGAAVLFQWKMEHDVVDAVLHHHDDAVSSPRDMGGLLKAADYLAYADGLGFAGTETRPADEMLAAYRCATEKELDATLDELRAAFATEAALLA